MTVRYSLKPPKTDEETRHLQIIVSRGRGRRIRVHTGYRFKPDDWLQDKQALRKTVTGAGDLNGALDRLHADVRALALDHPDDKELREAIRERVGRGNAKPSKTLFDYYADFLRFKRMHVAANTVKVFATLQKHMMKHLPKSMTPDDIRPATISEFQAALLAGGMANNSANKYAARLRTFFLWLEENEVIDSAPRMKSLKVANTEVVRLTANELEQMRNVDLSEHQPGFAHARDLFVFSAATGLRFSDCRALTWESVREDAIYLHEQKTGVHQRIPLTGLAVEVIERYRGTRQPLPAISNQKCNQYIREVAKLAGIDAPVTLRASRGGMTESETIPKHEAVTMHCARKTFVSLLLEGGMSPKDLLGTTHSDLRTLQKYAGKSEDHLRRAMAAQFGEVAR